jgi:hypothetical protein
LGARQKSGRRKFDNWSRLGGKPLISLTSLVETRLVAPLLEHGFERVGCYLRLPDEPTMGSEIRLEVEEHAEIISVTFKFDKYHRPAFQVHLARRRAEPPHSWVRSANVVRRPGQFYCFWGKPGWLPTRLWSVRMSEQAVDRVAGHLGQALAFLENGYRAPCISREVS